VNDRNYVWEHGVQRPIDMLEKDYAVEDCLSRSLNTGSMQTMGLS
jgi:hypothetical protein